MTSAHPADREHRPDATAADLNQRSLAELCDERSLLIDAFRACRSRSSALAEPLSAEDQLIQSMPDASPTKWHLAHTTWFFETFILAEHALDHEWYAAEFRVLYNSYYNGIGEQHPRPRRGMISRPSLDQVRDYRAEVDTGLTGLLERADRAQLRALAPLAVLGINHEQQHQELIVTDVKHALAQNPTRPAYAKGRDEAVRPASAAVRAASAPNWRAVPAGEYRIGRSGHGFAFDNEGPAHSVLLGDFALADRPVSNGEWLEFMAAGGYGDPLLWLADGWAWRESEKIEAPLYWRRTREGDWRQFTLRGERPLDPTAPVQHVSGYEADAFARWAGARLPTEAEWEAAVRNGRIGQYPGAAAPGSDCRAAGAAPEAGAGTVGALLRQEQDGVWEWTASAYAPYPGFRPEGGAVGEYNGKFMINQLVLRGASGATAPGHTRPAYRNFFYPWQRWQYSGLRLARDS